MKIGNMGGMFARGMHGCSGRMSGPMNDRQTTSLVQAMARVVPLVIKYTGDQNTRSSERINRDLTRLEDKIAATEKRKDLLDPTNTFEISRLNAKILEGKKTLDVKKKDLEDEKSSLEKFQTAMKKLMGSSLGRSGFGKLGRYNSIFGRSDFGEYGLGKFNSSSRFSFGSRLFA